MNHSVFQAISLGAGIQSTTLTLMALHREFAQMPDCAIFADTGWEPARVYKHLLWLRELAAEKGFPIYIVNAGNIREDAIDGLQGNRFSSMPLHIRNEDGSAGMLKRQCTTTYKIRPIYREIRRFLGRKPGPGDVEVWIGISMDEYLRMKPARVKWVVNRWPLIEKRMRRSDCIRWLEQHGYPIPGKSACIGCPYHSNAVWREMRENDLVSWKDAVEFDKAVRRFPQLDSEAFLHRSLVSLEQVDLPTLEDYGQLDLFAEECEGMCGV